MSKWLKNAPPGPIELDASLLYSSASEAEEEAHQEDNSTGLSRVDNKDEKERLVDQCAQKNQCQEAEIATQLTNQRVTEEILALNEQALRRYLEDAMQQDEDGEHGGRAFESPLSWLGEDARASLKDVRTSHIDSVAIKHRSRAKALQRLEQIRHERDEKELRECTFAPKVGRPPLGPRATLYQMPVEERLLSTSGQGKETVVRRVIHEREEAEKEECTFKPCFITDPEAHLDARSWKPLHKRLEAEWNKKKSLLEEASRKFDDKLTFRPQLCPNSRALIEKKKKRLQSPQINEKNDILCSARKYPFTRDKGHNSSDPNALESCPFNPKIDSRSKVIMENSNNVPSDFLSRQRFFNEEKEKRLEKLKCLVDNSKTCTFRPEIDKSATSILALSDTRFDQLIENEEERYSRLASWQSSGVLSRSNHLRREDEQRSLFSPELNPKSLQIARVSSARRLVTDLQAELTFRHERRENRKNVIQAQLERECTFVPDTSKPEVFGYYGKYSPPDVSNCLNLAVALDKEGGLEEFSLKVDEKRRQKEEWAEDARKAREAKELQECSFAPDTSKPVIKMPKGPVHVAGMDRFLENRANAERQAAEAMRRAAKVWNLHPRARSGATAPKPFRLILESRLGSSMKRTEGS